MGPNISKAAINEKPRTEYYNCQITGFGTRMIPPYTKTQNRMKKETISGYLMGVVTTWSRELRTRHIDVFNKPHAADRVYDLGVIPELTDEVRILQRLRDEYTLLEDRIIIVDYAYDRGAWHAKPTIAPREFQIPVTLSEHTQPENEPPHMPTEETAPPLEVSLGDIARHNRKTKKEKRVEE